MDSEIREYEEQLAEVRDALQLEKSEELVELERELIGLIAELKKKKVPKFPPGSSVVATGDQCASVVSVAGQYPHYLYTIKLNSGNKEETRNSVPESELEFHKKATKSIPVTDGTADSHANQKTEAIRDSSSDSMAGLSPGSNANSKSEQGEDVESPRSIKHDAAKSKCPKAYNKPSSNEPQDTIYEEGRSKWQQFAHKKGPKKASGPTAARGVSKKTTNPVRRPHFAK